MTIKRKIIERGDLEKTDMNEWVNFTLRIQKKMLLDIEEVLNKTVGISKTGWILQAIQKDLNNNKE